MTLLPIETPICVACFKRLTVGERRAYGYRCEACEGKWHARIVAWLNGSEDRELDSAAGFLHCQRCRTERQCAAQHRCGQAGSHG